MDAVIQVEASEVRAIVTSTNVIIFTGLQDDSLVSAWITVSFDDLLFFESSIKTNAPNSLLILV